MCAVTKLIDLFPKTSIDILHELYAVLLTEHCPQQNYDGSRHDL